MEISRSEHAVEEAQLAKAAAEKRAAATNDASVFRFLLEAAVVSIVFIALLVLVLRSVLSRLAKATIVVQGRLTHVRQTTETYSDSGLIRSANAWSFRIDDRAAVYKNRFAASLSDGDLVTAAGRDSKGTFQTYALRNDTTGAVHKALAGRLLIGGGLLAALGVPMLFLLIGFLMVPVGLAYLWIGIKLSSANQALAAAPTRQAD